MDDEQRQVCGEIAEHYGQKKQEFQAVQELSELICLLTRRPEQRTPTFTAQLIDEIADSLIMIEQIRQIHFISDYELSDRIDYKLARQQSRIKGET